MMFALGFVGGAVFMLAVIMIVGSIEWETTYTVEKDDK